MQRRFLLILVPMLLASGIGHAAAVFIRLHEAVQASGDVLMLKHVAEIVSEDPDAARRLAETPICVVGQALDGGGVDRGEIQRALAPTAMLLGVELEWGGARQVSVTVPPAELDFGEAIDAIAATLVSRMPEQVNMTAVVVNAPAPLRLAGAEARIEPDLMAMAVDEQFITVPLKVFSDGREIDERSVTFEIKPWTRAGTKSSSPRKRAHSAPGTRSTEPSSSPVIHRKDRVRIVLRTGPVSIEAEGRALADARAGETLRVRRTSGGVLSARAVTSGVVEVGVE